MAFYLLHNYMDFIIISILYVAIGLVVIYKMAPKTFKIKE